MAFNFVFRIIEIAKAIAVVLYIRMRWEIWGHSNVRNKPQIASGKDRVSLRVEMKIEKSNYSSGAKKYLE